MGDPAGDSGGSRGQAWVSGAPRSGPRPGSGPSAAHVRSRVEAEAQSRGPRGREFAVPWPLGPAWAPWLLVPGRLRVNSDSPGGFRGLLRCSQRWWLAAWVSFEVGLRDVCVGPSWKSCIQPGPAAAPVM